MNRSRRCFTLLFILLLSKQIIPGITQQQQQQASNEDKPSRFQIVSNTLSLLKKAHKNSVEKIKTIVHDLRLQFTSPKPDEDERKTTNETYEGNAEETRKPVAESVEKTDKPPVKTADENDKSEPETVQKTGEKVEKDDSDKKESHDEL